MSFTNSQQLVECDWLEKRLEDPDLRILDCTVLVHFTEDKLGVKSGRETWAQGHIPGSAFADLVAELSDPNHLLPLMMPPEEQFAEAMSRYGVGKGTRVVLYDAGANMWAARVWWMLRVFGFDDAAVLNGGWPKWKQEGRPVSTEPPAYPPANFVAWYRPELIASKEDVLAAIDEGNSCLMNALTAEEHQGSVVHYARPGHIPSSTNVAARSIVDPETFAYLPEAQLRERMAAAGAMSGDRVITYCGGGIAASSNAFILTLLGVENVAVYDGSLLEWAPDPDLPMTIPTL